MTCDDPAMIQLSPAMTSDRKFFPSWRSEFRYFIDVAVELAVMDKFFNPRARYCAQLEIFFVMG